MSAHRPGHAGCHCCESFTPAQRVPIHRDLVTGEPLENQPTRDALEVLWSCHDGDLAGLTQETVAVNCSATASVVFNNSNADPADAPGCLQFSVEATPTDDEFAALHIIWTGESFDAFAHLAHIASGSLRLDCATRRRPSSFDPNGELVHKAFGPLGQEFFEYVGTYPMGLTQAFGLVMRVGSTLFLIASNLGTAIDEGESLFPTGCWRIGYATNISVLDGATIRQATTAELRSASLVVDPIANQGTHEVGFFFGIVSETTAYTRTARPSYTANYQFDMIDIYSLYDLNCVAAFVNKTDLTVSCPTEILQNVEPVEMRGFSAKLTLTTLPDWDEALHSRAVQAHYDAGYSYLGTGTATTVLGDVTITIYYLPCNRLTLLFDNGGACPAWVFIRHYDTYSEDACEDPDRTSFADDANGIATAPTFAGHSLRDYYRPCVSAAFNPLLSAIWAGSDCAGHLNESSIRRVDGIRGQCRGLADPGDSEPVCVQGILPNQLYWMTNCYSLDPIAIGYRRRVKDGYGLGSLGGCGTTTPFCDAAPDGASRLNTYCGISHLKSMGFTFALDGILGSSDHVSGHFYLDITE